MVLYDYVYVDLAKVISLYSQITGGVVELRETNREHVQTADNKRNYDFKVFRHDAGGTKEDRSALRELTKPHHALLTELEDELASKGYLVDLTDPQHQRRLSDENFRQLLKSSLCLKVRGRAVVEDYDRIKAIARVFPAIVKFINQSQESNLRSSPAYADLQKGIEETEREIKNHPDRNERTRKQSQLKAMKQSIQDLVAGARTLGLVDQWVLDGFQTWIDAFLPGIVNLRIYPASDQPDEHVFGHLKKSFFEDPDPNSFHFTYGSLPTEELTMIGIITSVPHVGGETFKPLSEFDKGSLADYESVEQAFRGIFRGFDGIEKMVRTSRYPRVLVYPLTVYRSVPPNAGLQGAAH